MIYLDDCLNVLKKLEKESVDLIYLDPPFFTQKVQKLSKNSQIYTFDDVWDSKQDYLNYLKERLVLMKDVLKDSGSIFLHCDDIASFNLKLLMDEIFLEQNFRNEIIWTYKRWSNAKRALNSNHQTIFFYSKSNNFKFNILYKDYAKTTNLDQIMQKRDRVNGKTVYKKDERGEIVFSKEKKGVSLSDVWEIPFLNPKAKERVGYPTQKPLLLLERIISLTTDENDLVLDPFMGSGTTLVSAKLLNRRYIGIDKNEDAFNITKERLLNPIISKSYLLERGEDFYDRKKGEEFSILEQFDCVYVQRNKGIDAFLKKTYKGSPVALKVQRESESIERAIELLDKASRSKQCSLAILITKEHYQGLLPSHLKILNPLSVQLDLMLEY